MKGFSQCLILGLTWLLVACSQEHAEVSSQVVAQSVPVQLTIDADFEDEALQEDLRELVLNFQPNTFKPILRNIGTEVPLNLVFSNGGSPIYRTVTFKVNDKQKLEYKGPIDVPNFSGNSKWYVTAFYGGTKDGEAYTYAPASHIYSAEKATKGIYLGINTFGYPYMSGWTPINTSFNKDSKEWQGSFSLKIKPVGYLLRLKVKNDRDYKLMVRVIKTIPGREDVFFGARFTPTISKEAFESGAFPSVSKPNTNQTERLTIGGGGRNGYGWEINKKSSSSEVALVWVMPMQPIKSKTNISLRLAHYNYGAEWYFPFSISLDKNDETGVGGMSGIKTVAVPNNHKIYRTLYPFDYIAKTNELGMTSWNNYAGKTSSENMTLKDWQSILSSSPQALAGSTKHRYAKITVDGKTALYRYLWENGSLAVDMIHGTFDDSAAEGAFFVGAEADASYFDKAREYGEIVTRTFPGNASDWTYYMGANEGSLVDVYWSRTFGEIRTSITNRPTPRGRERFLRLKKGEPQLMDY